MFRRRRERPNSSSSPSPPVPRQVPTSGLPPNTPGVQIFGENYSGPRVLEHTDLQATMERKSKIASIVKSVRIQKTRDPVEKLKIQLKELDRALDDGTLDQFEYEEARRTVLEQAKKAIANKKKRASVQNVEMTPSAFEQQATEELENNDEVQTLLVSNQVVSAVPLNTKSSINQANEVLVHIEDETEALLRDLEEAPDVPEEEVAQTQASQPQQPAEPRVVSAFVIEDVDTSNIVLGDGDFVIESPASHPEASTEEPVVVVAEEEPVIEVELPEAQPEPTQDAQPEASSVIFGGGVMFTVDESEDAPTTAGKNEVEELEMLMMDFPSDKPKQKSKKQAATPKPVKSVVVEPLRPTKTQEDIEKQQAIDFGFKQENPPNRAKEAAVVVKPVQVKEQAKATTPEPEEEEETTAPVNPSFTGNMFLGLEEVNEAPTEKQNVTEEDELALLMMDAPVTKPKPAAKPKPAPTKTNKPLVIPALEKPKPKLKPQKKKEMPKKPKMKLSYKESKQAILTKEDEEAMAFLLSGENPTSVVKKPSRTVVNNAVQLVAQEESEESDSSDDELRYAGTAKPVFVTTANQPSLVQKKKPKRKPKKVEALYPTDRLETQGPVTKVDAPVEASVRSNLVHGLLKGMEAEGKTAKQCLTSLQDLVRWKTITEDELALGKQILVKTKGLVL